MNIFESIQSAYNTNLYKNMNSIFNELRDILPEKINIPTEGITDEKTLFFLNELNGCSLGTDDPYIVYFIKENEVLFEWDLKKCDFWIFCNEILHIFEHVVNRHQMQFLLKIILEHHCKIADTIPCW